MAFELDLDSARGVFFTEARQLLGEVESYVLQLEADPTDAETLNAAFRAAHTIKGSAGVFGLSVITHFVHNLETVLDRVRNSEISFDADMSSLVLECRDHISDLVDAIEGGADAEQVPADQKDTQDGLTARLKKYLAVEGGTASESETPVTQTSAASSPATSQVWQISLRLGQSTLCDGFDPLPILNYLSSIGTVEKM
ncbi:MAG: Hpt domain-containing protein, partial [Limnobacter sp.]|nr:Hpt domain-containing protein [Limnobacter sp.]